MQQLVELIVTTHGSNRTFMELKCLTPQMYLGLRVRSNRTFMELKFEIGESVRIELYVLIVPLWN